MSQPSDFMQGAPSQAKSSPLQKWLLSSGNFFFRFRNFLFPTIYVLLPILTKPALFLGNPHLDRFVVALGIALVLLGQGFRLLVIGFAYIKRGGKDRRVYADDLVDQGLYAHTRNPMYVGNLLILAGIGIVYGSPWIYFFVIPFFVYIYLAITAAEENYLKNKFGVVYEDYMRRVNRFWPNLRGLTNSLQGYNYDWKKALRKEYGTVFVSLTGLVLVNIWKLYWVYGLSARHDEIFAWSLLLIPITLFYVTTWYLKKAGKLG